MSRARLHDMSLIAVPLVFAAALHAQAVPPAPAAAPDLSDPEVAHVAVTANNIDIDAAKFAQTRTHNAGVKQFAATMIDRKSTRLNSSHLVISYAVFCLKKQNN